MTVQIQNDIEATSMVSDRIVDFSELRGSSAYLNIVDFGAIGDGTTDDTAAFIAALSAAAVSDSTTTIFFPKGQYKLTGPISIGANITLTGSDATLRSSAPTTTLLSVVGSNVTIQNLNFDGSL